MASFSNIHNTAATIGSAFSYFDYANTLSLGAESLSYAMGTIAYEEPTYSEINNDSVWLQWQNGTDIYAGFSSAGATSATIKELYIDSSLGSTSGWLGVWGNAKIGYTNGEITSISPFSLKSATLWAYDFTNGTAADLTFDGSMKLNIETGAFSGKASVVSMKWVNDDPTTDTLEWDYVTLKGSFNLGNDGLNLPSISGKITDIEWGSGLDDLNDKAQYAPAGKATGLKLDASSAMNALAVDGFAGLSANLYTGNDTITGTAGDDFLDASTGNDKVDGGAGDDYIDGGAGNDKISDDSGNNTIVDESGNAQITLGTGNDDVFTGAGNDKINAGDGVNWVESGAGNDNITTGVHADFIFAGSGNDKVVAGNGDNWVDGGAGNDTTTTGAGADVIYGGEGADKIWGGAGSDVFVFDNVAVSGKDVINDFNAAEDFFAFDTSVFTSLAGGISAENVVVGAKAVALDTHDYLILDAQGGKLYYDADGSGAGAAVQIAVVKGSLTGMEDGHNFIDEAVLFA